jgi:glycerol-3-phosphate dehydrogenase
MHIDPDQLETAGSQRSPVCIIGGGIARLVLAQRLARFGLEVSVLEAVDWSSRIAATKVEEKSGTDGEETRQ